MNLICTEILDTESITSSNTAFVEEAVESIPFTIPADDYYLINIHIPVSVYAILDGNKNAACRVYLDGDGYLTSGLGAGKQWNGLLLCNGGQWCSKAMIPVDGRVSYSAILNLAAGDHILHTRMSGSTTETILKIHGRRCYQVVKLC